MRPTVMEKDASRSTILQQYNFSLDKTLSGKRCSRGRQRSRRYPIRRRRLLNPQTRSKAAAVRASKTLASKANQKIGSCHPPKEKLSLLSPSSMWTPSTISKCLTVNGSRRTRRPLPTLPSRTVGMRMVLDSLAANEALCKSLLPLLPGAAHTAVPRRRSRRATTASLWSGVPWRLRPLPQSRTTASPSCPTRTSCRGKFRPSARKARHTAHYLLAYYRAKGSHQ